MKSVHPFGTVSSLGVYSHDVQVPLEPFIYGIGDIKVVSTLCPGGKERLRRLMELVRMKKLNLKQLLTHKFALENIKDAYEFFAQQHDGVLKVALYPQVAQEKQAQMKWGEQVMHPEMMEEEEEEEIRISA